MNPKPMKEQNEEKPGDTAGNNDSTCQQSSDLEIEKKWLQFARIDIEKFELLYRKYYSKIYRSIYLMVRDEDVASNLTDETFSRAVDKLDSFKWQGFTFGAWLFQIARNVVSQEFRRRKSRPVMSYDPQQHDCDNGSRPDADVEQLEDYRILMACLDNLQPDKKEVFINRYGMGMKTREIAIVMGMPEATVKSHLQRGRKQLQKCLIANGVERGLSPGATLIVRRATAQDGGWAVLEDGDEKLTGEKISELGEGGQND